MDRLNQIEKYYLPRLEKNQIDCKILGWENEKAQLLRFQVLDSVIKEKASLLDVGCGLGNLYEYFQKKMISIHYTGVDLLPEMIKLARERYPGVSFVDGDIFKMGLFEDKRFDFLYASGIFNIDLGNNLSFLENALLKFRQLTNNTIVFNLLHIRSKTKEPGYFYFVPEEVTALIYSLLGKENKVKIIENYLDNDFSVIIDLPKIS